MKWKHVNRFEELTPADVYNILKLRQDIFIIEQDCIYEDIDSLDTECEHLMLYDENKLVAYSRIVPAGKKFTSPSIGRIIVAKAYRGDGLGRILVEKSVDILKMAGEQTILIEAQLYLNHFYESIGFITISDPYDIDGIDHIKMKLTL